MKRIAMALILAIGVSSNLTAQEHPSGITGSSEKGDWRQWRGDKRDGLSADEIASLQGFLLSQRLQVPLE